MPGHQSEALQDDDGDDFVRYESGGDVTVAGCSAFLAGIAGEGTEGQAITVDGYVAQYIDGDEAVFADGEHKGNFIIVRFETDGQVDTSFGNSGLWRPN